MKKTSILSLLFMLSVVVYTYFFVFQKEQIKLDQQREDKRVATSEGLEKIEIKTSDTEYRLEYKEGQWWITSPILYPANPEFLERSLTVMNQVLADSIFKLEKDEYGFSQSESEMVLEYTLGAKKTLVLGKATGSNSQIYLLDKESQQVYVVHNVWGQLYYYEMKNMLSPFLPIRNWKIESVELKAHGKSQWEAQKNGDKWSIQKSGKTYEIAQAQLLWWLQSIRSVEVKPLQFDEKPTDSPTSELIVKAPQGEEHLLFNKKADRVYISSLKAIAELDSFSLKSIELELEKVVKSAQ